jgi:Zn-dependent peptidase ImmA (M78 family)
LALPEAALVASKFRDLAKQHKAPVDLDAVVRAFPELHVIKAQLDGEGLFVDLGNHGAEIYLRQDAHPFRRNFTLAHELGHFALRNVAEQHFTYRSSKKVHSQIENWCNTFAANLLLPSEWVLDFIRQNKVSGLLDSVLTGAHRFGVSREAFYMRVVEVAPISIYLFDIIHSKTKQFYLSNVQDSVRWNSAMNAILSDVARQPNGWTTSEVDGHLLIQARHSKTTTKDEAIFVLMAMSKPQ